MLVTHNCCSEGVWSVGDSTFEKNKVANTIRSLGYSKRVNKSDQELTIRSTERNCSREFFLFSISKTCVVPKLFATFASGCEPTESRTRISECKGRSEPSSWKDQGQPITNHVAVAVRVAVHTLLFWRKSGDDGFTAIQRVKGRSTTAPWSRFGERIMYPI